MKDHRHIFCGICDICGVPSRAPETRDPANYDLPREAHQRLHLRLGAMHGVSRIWEQPRKIEDDLENARRKLREAIEAVEQLDNFAKHLARRESTKAIDQEREARIVAAAERTSDADSFEKELVDIDNWYAENFPKASVDEATIAQIKALSEALVRPIERAIPLVQEGRGRPRNLRAYAVAEHAYVIFEELTGQKPTYWNARETTPFGRLVEFLFDAYGIKSTVRKPIEAAMHKFGFEG